MSINNGRRGPIVVRVDGGLGVAIVRVGVGNSVVGMVLCQVPRDVVELSAMDLEVR